MVLSDLAIKRPVFATVVSLLLVVLGLAAAMRLSVREYPDIDAPVVSVTTTWRGAPAELIESRVTEVVEGAVAGIEGIRTVTAGSRDGRSRVSIEFNIDRDIEAAANDVRDKVARVADDLPDDADAPVVAKTDADARAMMWVSLTSDVRDSLALTDYAQRYMVDRLSVVPGVASVYIGGERRYAMRIWLDRKALAARHLTVEDVTRALEAENIEVPAGRLESLDRELTVRTDTRFSSEREFRRLIVAKVDDQPVRLGEVAEIEVGSEDARGEVRANGRTAIGLGVIRQSKSNTLEVADGIRAEIERMKPSLPPDIKVTVGYDESVFISEAIYEVFHALAVALVLVIVVIFVFLRSAAATLIPAVAIPVSVIGAVIVLGAFDFSINVLTLLALVLAIGLVVDDAIVVLENIHRRIEDGEPPLLAAARGARQIGFAVIATTLVLVAVFVPISYMEGRTGRLFGEFGIALAASVLVSALVALTLTPMMCSKLLKPSGREHWLERASQGVFDGLARGYGVLLSRAVSMPLVVLAVAGAVSAAVLLFQTLPKEFAPTEDRGAFIVPIQAPQGSSFDYTRRHVLEIEQRLKPLVESGDAEVVFAIVAPGSQRPAPVDRAFVFVRLQPWDQRDRRQQEIVRETFPKLLGIPGVRAFAVNPPSLGQRGFGAPLQVVVGGPDMEQVKQWRDRLVEALEADGRLVNVDSDYKETKPQLDIEIDRDRAADLGISVEAIGATLEVMLAGRNVTRYRDRGEQYDVVLQARAGDRATPRDLENMFIRSARTGDLVPLSNLVRLVETAGPPELTRVDRLPAITVSASLAPDVLLGDAIEIVERAAAEVLPAEARISYSGQAREYQETGGSLYVTFALALLIVFLVLAAQFESYVHPLIIMLSVPLALTGGLAALAIMGISLNIYSQIGMVLLIGLMAKNGILIVEFANQLRDQGLSPRDAVLKASVLRLRPILMTTIATIFGALPLAMGSGAGVESRSALAVVVMGGMALATLLTLFLVPTLYALLARFTRPVGGIAARLSRLEVEHEHPPADKDKAA